ncbi:MarR family transcriptional regulator [Streptomonospora sp. S1-112]|uniref:MarR family transcriptional regulator n=1 Tax=Streptomonospora mangrovi TaxID=2883123 RepID=A0A9X3SDI2_9ACTN|nr:MarR family transcriptional regulator [Streptomonospora mangrovi]MDA0564838.1 MarR family transcriptional regulator [Streptomonospora mangrovi]
MGSWRGSAQRRAWRPYIEASLLLETRLDEDLRSSAGMSLMDYHLLLVLAEAPGRRLRMGELAGRMVFSPSRLTYQVKALERRGWVVRHPSAEDRRVAFAVLTAAGLEALRDADRTHIATVRRLFTDDLDDHELDVLSRVFTRTRARLQGASGGASGGGASGDGVTGDGVTGDQGEGC